MGGSSSSSSTLCDLTCPPHSLTSIIRELDRAGLALAGRVGHTAADQRERQGKSLRTFETVQRECDEDGNYCWIKQHFDWGTDWPVVGKTWKNDLEFSKASMDWHTASLPLSSLSSQTHTYMHNSTHKYREKETHTWVSTHTSTPSLLFLGLSLVRKKKKNEHTVTYGKLE